MKQNQPSKTIWVVSTEPASTKYGSSNFSTSEYIFKEEIDVEKLKIMVMEFSNNISEVFDSLEQKEKKYFIDSIELSAVMAADGKLGILGSSVGAKIEGSIKFILKRKTK